MKMLTSMPGTESEVEWLALLLHIREVAGSNLDPETLTISMVSLSHSKQVPEYHFKTGHDRAFPAPPFNSLFSNYPINSSMLKSELL
jgi:hypothetical protein